jgi:UDP-glucose 4-epimerase
VRVLVTGGAGYIGSFTVDALQAEGHEVVVFDNLSYGHREAVSAEIVVGDLADEARLGECLAEREFEAVIHFAGSIEAGISMVEAGRFFANNVSNSITLLNAARAARIQHVVFSSSAGVYGNPERVPIKETDATVPINAYAATKLLVEEILVWYEKVHGMRSVSLRYFNAAGAALDGSKGQDHQPATHILSVAIETALGQRNVFPLFGDDYDTPDGTCIRDYIHVLDLASAHVMALSYLLDGGVNEVLNVGAGQGYSNREVIGSVQRTSGVDFAVEARPRRLGDPSRLIADVGRIRQVLGWRAEHSDLDTIVSSAWKWLSTHPHGYGS